MPLSTPIVPNPQDPVYVSSNSIHKRDIDTSRVISTDWTGSVVDLFSGLYSRVSNTSATNPKILYIPFHRTVYTDSIGLGCNDGNSFSNIRVELIGSGGTIRATIDTYKDDATARTSLLIQFTPQAFNAVRLSFYTANTVCLTNMTIRKAMITESTLKALKPDGTTTYIDATAGGNLKISLEELESGVSVNSNTQLRVTPYHASGIEGIKISDHYGFHAESTPTGELRTIEPTRLVGAGFEGNTIDPRFWTTGASGAGASIAQTGSEIILTSGTANAAAVYAYSVRRARFVAGTTMRFRDVGRLGDTGTANNKRRWGIGWGATMPTITDGAWFQLDGTEFSVVTCKGGSEEKVTIFNGDLGTSYSPSTNMGSSEIYYTHEEVKFVLNDITLHTVTATTGTWSNTINFHTFANSLNSDVLGASVIFASCTNSIYRLGKLETQPNYYHISGDAATHVLKLGPGILHKVIYNNTSGTSLQFIDNVTGTSPSIGTITTASGALGEWDYSVPFNDGLIAITVGNGLDATVVYE